MLQNNKKKGDKKNLIPIKLAYLNPSTIALSGFLLPIKVAEHVSIREGHLYLLTTFSKCNVSTRSISSSAPSISCLLAKLTKIEQQKTKRKFIDINKIINRFIIPSVHAVLIRQYIKIESIFKIYKMITNKKTKNSNVELYIYIYMWGQ